MCFFVTSGIVECMAAGLVMVAHRSGGPLMDIVTDTEQLGFLAADADEYAAALHRVIRMEPQRRRCIQQAARCAPAAFFLSTGFDPEVCAKTWDP